MVAAHGADPARGRAAAVPGFVGESVTADRVYSPAVAEQAVACVAGFARASAESDHPVGALVAGMAAGHVDDLALAAVERVVLARVAPA